MGDLLGSLVQESQKRTILCIIGVGCYKCTMSYDVIISSVFYIHVILQVSLG
jgi:hypothetical protein